MKGGAYFITEEQSQSDELYGELYEESVAVWGINLHTNYPDAAMFVLASYADSGRMLQICSTEITGDELQLSLPTAGAATVRAFVLTADCVPIRDFYEITLEDLGI